MDEKEGQKAERERERDRSMLGIMRVREIFSSFLYNLKFTEIFRRSLFYLTIIEGVVVLPYWFGLVGLGHRHRQAVLGHVLAKLGHIVAEYA